MLAMLVETVGYVNILLVFTITFLAGATLFAFVLVMLREVALKETFYCIDASAPMKAEADEPEEGQDDAADKKQPADKHFTIPGVDTPITLSTLIVRSEG